MREDLTSFIEKYKEHFTWCKTMSKPFFDDHPLIKMREQSTPSPEIIKLSTDSMINLPLYQTSMPPNLASMKFSQK